MYVPGTKEEEIFRCWVLNICHQNFIYTNKFLWQETIKMTLIKSIKYI